MGVPIALGYKEDDASGAQVIDGGLRFDSAKSHYLTRTPSSVGNRRTFTWSGWIKNGRINTSAEQTFWGAGPNQSAGTADSNTLLGIFYNGAAQINVGSAVYAWKETTAYQRDYSGWYHYVLSVDTTASTAATRLKLWINNVQQTFSTDRDLYSAADTAINNTTAHNIGRNVSSSSRYFDGEMSQVYFIDGQALDPSYFGYTDPLTNTWRPKKFKPQATPNDGTVWSSAGNFSGDVRSQGDSYGPPKMFNGIIGNESTTGAVCFAPYSSNSTCTWTSPITFTGLTSLRLYVDLSGSVGKLFVNGTDYSSLVTALSGGDGWITIPQSSLSTITFGYTNGLNDATGIAAVEVNGVPLLDSDTTNMGANAFYLPFDGNSPIGQDQSGRGNNWTPVNFGGSNTIEKATGALPILNTDGGGKVARVGVRTDSNASSLVLALPLVGIKSDFSNAINSGTSNKAITANGNAAASSVQSNFYGGSFAFDGTGDYVYPAQNSDFSFGTGDFTIECWGYATSISNTLNTFFDTRKVSDGTVGFGVFLNSSGQWRVDAGTGSGISAGNAGTGIVNKWYHVALVRDSGTVKLFVDGNLNGSVSNTTNLTSQDITIGYNYDRSSWSFTGYLQDLRIYKGVAKYTQNFIPASTDPDILPDTPSGVAYSSNVTAITEGAVAFDGNGDYLSGASTSQFTTDAQYTIDGFVYIVSAPSSESGVLIFDTGSGGNDPELNIYNNGGNLQLYESLSNNTNWNGGAPYMSVGRWYYFKQTVNGTSSTDSAATNKLYLNGQLGVSNTINLSARSASSIFAIGARTNGTVAFNGFISNLRYRNIVDDSLTVPTSLFDTDANTKLLCCKSNSSATAADVTPGTITANGNAVATNFNPFTVNINTQRGQESGYATLNPLDNPSSCTLSNGNLSFSYTATQSCTRATIGIATNTGKYYWENYITTVGAFTPGIADAATNRDTDYVGESAGSYGLFSISGSAYKYNNNSGSSISGTAYGNGDTVMIAYDSNTGKFYGGCNGLWYGGSDPVAGTNPLYTATSNTYFPAIGGGLAGACAGSINFGQKPFKFPPPAGFQPLALANTPRPTIVRPDQYVGIVTYTGTSANPATITSDDFSFTPDFVWVKSRSNAESHALYDSVRGATYRLRSDTTGGETTGANELQSFIPGGFTAGNNGHIYFNNYTYAAWCWKAGGNSNTFNINDVGYATAEAAGLTAGTITPTGASVNTKSGFSIITHSGSGSTGSISHGLQKAPAFIITKIRSNSVTSSWQVYHQSLGATKYITLDEGADAQTSSTRWNDTAPTSSLISLGSNTASSYDWIIYAWAEIPGFSKFGSYTGNGSSDGPMIVTGFKPAFLLIKHTNTTTGDRATIQDTNRSKYNPSNVTLSPNLANAELGSAFDVDILSNGFKIRNTNDGHNKSNVTYIYAAFAEAPSFNLYGGQANAR